MKGLIHIYDGDGKGKTTAAVGLGIRCAGSGGKVVFAQFLKDNQSSELNLLKTLDSIRVISSEKVFGFYWSMTKMEKDEAKEVYSKLLEEVVLLTANEEYQMLILDEIIAAYNLNLVDRASFLSFLKNKPKHLEVVLTGRDPGEELVELADYVSEIKKVKHPYDTGMGARIGIEH